TFRRRLLSHRGAAARTAASPQHVAGLHVSGKVRPVPEAKQGDVEQFATGEGQKFSTNNPWMKAMLHALFDVWPRWMAYGELQEKVKARIAATSDDDERRTGKSALLPTLMQCYLAGLVELSQHPAPFVVEPSARPRAFAIA